MRTRSISTIASRLAQSSLCSRPLTGHSDPTWLTVPPRRAIPQAFTKGPKIARFADSGSRALLIHAPTLDDWRARPARPATKQLGKKVWPAGGVTASAPAAPATIGYCKELPAYRAVMTLDGDVRNFAIGPC